MPKPVLAADVRAYVAARPALVEGLSERAVHNLSSNGRLNPEVIAAFNRKRAKARRYVVGATTAANKARTAARAELVEKGLAGRRGPLPKSLKG